MNAKAPKPYEGGAQLREHLRRCVMLERQHDRHAASDTYTLYFGKEDHAQAFQEFLAKHNGLKATSSPCGLTLDGQTFYPVECPSTKKLKYLAPFEFEVNSWILRHKHRYMENPSVFESIERLVSLGVIPDMG